MKRIGFFLAVAAFVAAAKAQTMERVFAEMPENVLPAMTYNNRLDCADFFKSKMKSNVDNAYGGKCELLAMSDNYLLVRPTVKSSVAVKRLVVALRDTVYVVVYTVDVPSRDSYIAFYDTAWKMLPVERFVSLPTKGDFLLHSDTCGAERLAYARAVSDDAFVCAELSENDDTLRFSLSTDALTPAEVGRLRQYMRDGIAYKWNGKTYVR